VTDYLILLRGINVGGKNRVPMARLRELLEELGHSNVSTYIASGNAIVRSDRPPGAIKRQIEAEPRRRRGFQAPTIRPSSSLSNDGG